jgi:hypothetical protein
LTSGRIRKLLSENFPLLNILIGRIGLVSVSIGPFQNGDTQWEYDAASGVIIWGMPYANSFGNGGSRTQDPNHPSVFGARVVIAHQTEICFSRIKTLRMQSITF